MTSMTRFQDFFLDFLIFSYYWLLFNSYHFIQISIAPIGLEKTLSGSQMMFPEKSLCFKWLNGSDTFFSHFPTEFLAFACFCCWFHSHKTYCDALLIEYASQISFSFPGGI